MANDFSLHEDTADSRTPLDSPHPHPNEDAIRLWLIDSTLQHLMRQQGILGLGANAVQQSLRTERDQIVARLQHLGARFDDR